MNKVATLLTHETTVEAARYALTRRLLPVLRHHMVVHMQPIGMIYEVLDRKLAADEPELAAVREGLAKINHLARSAVRSCLDVVSWIAPDPAAVIDLGAGVAECTELLRSNLMFRGFTISNEVGDAAYHVPQPALREVLAAAMIAATDAAQGPLELVIGFQLSGSEAVVSVDTRAGDSSGFTVEMAYRAMQWSDVACLAQAHGVRLAQLGGGARITFSITA